VRVRGAQRGELEALYRSSLPRFVRTASAIVGDEAGGRDAVQDAFVRAVRQRGTFRQEVALEAWVWRIVIHCALDLRASRRRERSDEPLGEEFVGNGLPEADVGWRWGFPPEVVDQTLARDELVRVQKENGENESLLERPERDRLALVEHLERPENPKLHPAVLPLRKPH
jgi:DNA-directed RNA polymerase specialized sigma24 family protein